MSTSSTLFSTLIFTNLLLFLVSLSDAAASSAPYQWLELTDLLRGSGPPALKDAAIGYDDITRNLILFGGEQNNVRAENTYL